MISGRPAFSPSGELQRAAELLSRYWTLAIPTALASLALGAVIIFGILSVVATAVLGHFAAGHVGTGLGLGMGLVVFCGLLLLGFIALYIAQGVVIRAAEDVLEDRPPDLAASFGAVLPRVPALLTALAACAAIWFVPLIFSVVLIGLPFLVLAGYFTMYVPAAVIVGGEGGLQAVGTSFRLASQHVGESVVAWIGMVIAIIAGQVANAVCAHLPIVNLIVPFAVGGLTSAYAALVGASFYAALRDGAPAGAYVSAGTMPPPPQPPRSGPPQIIR
jgi:hypothetical protein